MDMLNKIHLGHVLSVLKKIDDNSIDCVVCSPPYYGLRSYGTEPQIWMNGQVLCDEHEWGNNIPPRGKSNWETFTKKYHSPGSHKTTIGASSKKIENNATNNGNFCFHCNAWKGELGLEPTFELYLDHLWQIFDEIKRVLKKTGTCWVNLGDSYYAAKGRSGGRESEFQEERNKAGESLNRGYQQLGGYGSLTPLNAPQNGMQAKSLLQIPSRFSIGMIDRGWILRNSIIWYKRNCMPSSSKDRFTVDYEMMYFFTKSSTTQYWVNSKTMDCVSKQPLGIKGVENIDWEWRECPKCNSAKGVTKIEKDEAEKLSSPRARYHRVCKSKRCVAGKVKTSLWTGKDYWFEQQFEKSLDPESYTGRRPRNVAKIGEYDLKNYQMAGSIREDGTLSNEGKTYPNRNKRTVWDITPKPFKEAHFAVFPKELVETPIKAGCPEFVCNKCGKAREKIYNRGELTSEGGKGQAHFERRMDNRKAKATDNSMKAYENEFVGYTDCGCNAGFSPGVVLDPFIGSGTVGIVAKKLGREFIGIELKQEYKDMAENRMHKELGFFRD